MCVCVCGFKRSIYFIVDMLFEPSAHLSFEMSVNTKLRIPSRPPLLLR